MMDLKDRIAAQFGAEDFRTIEVPEWGEPAVFDELGNETKPASPLVIKFTPATLRDLEEARTLSDGSVALAHVRLVTKKALGVDGKRLFQMADAKFLMERADPEIVGRIARAISGDLPTETLIGTAEGNS